MRKLLASLFAAATVAAIASTAAFGAVNSSLPGTPGTPNCTGQTMIYLANYAPGGIGGAAKSLGYTVPQLKGIVVQYCSTGTPGTPSCVGETMSFFAQASKLELDAPGIGGLANYTNLTVQQVKQIVDQFCAAP